MERTDQNIAIAQTQAGGDGTRDATRVTVDEIEQDDWTIPLVDDHREHSVVVRVTVREDCATD